MPELPEVETVRRQLEPWLVGRTIVDGGGHESSKFNSAREAVGAQMVAVVRRGKYLLIELDDRRELVIHLGMTGVLRPRPADGDDAYVRAWWELDDGSTLQLRDVRRFGRVAVVPAGDHASMPTLHALGPEPLDAAWSASDLHRALSRSSARIKTQLLSQRPVAGVGNIYADEALWRARIHPAARSVSKPQAERLHVAIADVLRSAVANGGTTLRDYRTVAGDEGANQFHLECYGRRGEPCNRCGDELAGRVYDGRSTTFCRSCQRR